MLCLKVLDQEMHTVAVARGEQEVNLVVSREYQEGDRIVMDLFGEPCFLWLSVDDALGRSLVYMKEGLNYVIPFGEQRINLSPKAFAGKRHLIYVKEAKEFEIHMYRNLALNVNDQHGNTACYPHASANVETRGEAVFAAKNAIDGITANSSHGEWPYQSWGINRDPNARMKLDFGRIVETDRIVVYLRADFPHDSWWKEMTIHFSDGSVLKPELKKTAVGQEILFEKRQTKWIEISDLIPFEGEISPFPALTQIEVYGVEAI